MIIEGTIFSTAGGVVPGATVVAQEGNREWSVVADANGRYILNTGAGVAEQVRASAVEHHGASVAIEGAGNYEIDFELISKVKELPAVIVTGKKNNNGLLLGGLGLLALLALNKKNNGRVSGTGNGMATTAIIVAGCIVFFKAYGLFDNFIDGLKSIFNGLGLGTSKEEEEGNAEVSNPNSPWSPNFYKSAPAGSLLLSNAVCHERIEALKDCFGMFSDDEDKAIGILKQFKTQSQVSYFAERFYIEEGSDLATWLWKDNWPDDRLSASEFKTINDYVHKLPKYRV